MSSLATRLELDLDVFAGPLDLLCSLVLREDLDLLEVDLAGVVLAYLEHAEAAPQAAGQELETVTEFLVLVAALLELKSRLMLPGEEGEPLDELGPAEAAEELVARMLALLRHRGAAGWFVEREAAAQRCLARIAPLPTGLRSARHAGEPEAGHPPEALGAALGGLLRMPRPLDLGHLADPRVALGERLGVLRGLLRRGSFAFEDAVRGADRMTEAVTLFALLELYKRGEAAWDQAEPFGPIRVRRGPGVAQAARGAEVAA